jgi:HPt (histidine-containing phosphotransfer) domain-containing protein
MDAGRDVLAQVVDLFLQELPGRIASIAAAVERDEAPALEFAAHRLKGAAATLGAARLARLCDGLEQQGHDGSCAGAGEIVADVRRELERVRDALLAEISAPEVGP